MEFMTAAHTDIGIKKTTNQDSVLIQEAKTTKGNVLLAVICDGMGGLAKGEVASATVIQAFSKWFENDFPLMLSAGFSYEELEDRWKKIVFSMNDVISIYGKKNGINLGTTVLVFLIVDNTYYVLNVGDTRAYLISNTITQITKDQTFIQHEMDAGRMTKEEASVSPQRNVLLQCVGASNIVEPVFHTGRVCSGDVYLICSDGFRHVVSEAEMFERLNPAMAINEKSMLDNAVYLTELNKYRREPDNISVVLVRAD